MSAACDSAHVESVFVVAISSRSTDLSPCDFFLWGYAKGLVFVLPLPANMEEMNDRITAALETVTENMLQRDWHELEYRLNVCSHRRHSY